MATPIVNEVNNQQNRSVSLTWAAGANAETGAIAFVGDLQDISAQAVGDATSVAIHGSNDGVHFAVLATAVTLTIATGVTPVTKIVENPLYIRPVFTGGTSTIVTVVGKRR